MSKNSRRDGDSYHVAEFKIYVSDYCFSRLTETCDYLTEIYYDYILHLYKTYRDHKEFLYPNQYYNEYVKPRKPKTVSTSTILRVLDLADRDFYRALKKLNHSMNSKMVVKYFAENAYFYKPDLGFIPVRVETNTARDMLTKHKLKIPKLGYSLNLSSIGVTELDNVPLNAEFKMITVHPSRAKKNVVEVHILYDVNNSESDGFYNLIKR